MSVCFVATDALTICYQSLSPLVSSADGGTAVGGDSLEREDPPTLDFGVIGHSHCRGVYSRLSQGNYGPDVRGEMSVSKEKREFGRSGRGREDTLQNNQLLHLLTSKLHIAAAGSVRDVTAEHNFNHVARIDSRTRNASEALRR